jgi:hypothetical protein
VEEGFEVPTPTPFQRSMERKGCITVKFGFITNMRPKPPKPPTEGKPENVLLAIGAIPEKALKGDARSHQATYVNYLGVLRPD